MTPLDAYKAYVKKRLGEVNAVIETFETTSLKTGSRRGGKNVDTTAETLADFKRQKAELEALIKKHGKKPTLAEIGKKLNG